jgi:outer membrane immunogenic protein
MKKFVVAAAVAAFGFVGSASAADMPVKAPMAPAAPVAAPYSWYGFYIGGQVGYDWSREAINLTPDVNYTPAFLFGAVPYSLASNPHGVLGGIQWGSNWQFGHIVLGMASDFSFSDIKASQTSFNTVNPAGITIVGSQKLTWFSTSRVRGGYTVMDNLLLYGTGGLADGRASASSSVTVTGACGAGGNCPAGSRTKTLWGWAAGGGMEYAVGHWSVNVEYLHYDLGHLNYNMTDPTAPGAFIGASTKFSGDIVRGGINYRFDWTPLEFIFGRHS